MSLARLVVTAVRLEGRTKAEVARDYGVSARWIWILLRGLESEGIGCLSGEDSSDLVPTSLDTEMMDDGEAVLIARYDSRCRGPRLANVLESAGRRQPEPVSRISRNSVKHQVTPAVTT